MDIISQEFLNFLIEAKINTYASNGQLSEPSRPNSKDLKYETGKYLYIDTYLGAVNFIGEEAVFYDGVPIWGMNYFGEMLKKGTIPEGFIVCLRGALKAVPVHAPYRGPEKYCHGDFQYNCKWNGEIESFYGEEEISYKDEIIYRLRFHGGAIRY